MTANSRTLAQKHLWKSWLWGLVISLPTVWIYLVSNTSDLNSFHFIPPYLLYTSVTLGLPALLGAWLRRRMMEWVFRTSKSDLQLIWRTALVFEASVALLLLAYFLPVFASGNENREYRPAGLLFQLFFGLSLPWLLSSILTAWRLYQSQSDTAIPNKKMV
ncbi:hypothetical protein [Hymenobacter pini]|uniref:hypothetical protein n=1 Tax=Hymenobacter pini TaxID=2880879 RepID=UPI001CF256A6|nr:hypothetical protein [Hymenobacter pini]MCA8831418.1 hypothetical protein [Hymenobacter pini]